jgi:hypothetical protein
MNKMKRYKKEKEEILKRAIHELKVEGFQNITLKKKIDGLIALNVPLYAEKDGETYGFFPFFTSHPNVQERFIFKILQKYMYKLDKIIIVGKNKAECNKSIKKHCDIWEV